MSTLSNVCEDNAPKITITKSTPFISMNKSYESTNEDQQNILPSLPLNIMITTSNNTTLSLHLSETIGMNTITNSKSKFNKKQKPSQNSMQTDYNIGDLVIITKNKQGLIRYIGQLNGDANIWFGLELIGGHKGFHNGSFEGHKYFTCGENQGIFIKKHEIIRKMTITDFTENVKTKRKTSKMNKKKGNRKRNSLNDIRRNKTRKAGPRDIGRITSDNWTPIADADKIIEESTSSQRLRPQSARSRSTKRSIRSTSSNTKGKTCVNKNASLIPSTANASRSKTPSPSRFGLIIHEHKADDGDNNNSVLNEQERKKRQHSLGKCSRDVGFPDISKLMSAELQNVLRKRKIRRFKHMASMSTPNVIDTDDTVVIIGPSDALNGLNMSETSTVGVMDDIYDDDEDELFAEVNVEIDDIETNNAEKSI